MFAEAYTDPIAAFLAAWSRVRDTAPQGFEPSTVALATADTAGRPSVRSVLLKGVDERGFIFFTNYGSRKARELDANPRAALCFFWHWLGQQVRVEGGVVRTAAADSDEYFATRPRGSQMGAWASRQSEPVDSRAALEARLGEIEVRFGSGDVPRPPFWGGYRLTAERVEFWQEGEFRLHDRLLFTWADGAWRRQRLYP